MSDSPAENLESPIDAEFEPAKPQTKPRFRFGKLSWLAIFVVAALSITGLAIMALANGGLLNAAGRADPAQALSGQVAALQTQVNGLQSAQSELARSVEALRKSAPDSDTVNQGLSDRLETIETALKDLRNQSDQLSKTLKEMTPAAGRDGEPVLLKVNPELVARLDALESAFANLPEPAPVETSAPQTDYSGEIAALRAELIALKSAQDTQTKAAETAAAQAAEAALALSGIEAAARRGRPFLTAYQRLEAALPADTDALETLEPIAITGAPTLADLRVRFAPLRSEALNLNAKAGGQASGWFQSIFSDGITVRREGEVLAIDLLDAADAALASGDLGAAINAVETLEADVQLVFTDWVEGAKARAALETALESLRLMMISKDRL